LRVERLDDSETPKTLTLKVKRLRIVGVGLALGMVGKLDKDRTILHQDCLGIGELA
jgi:hypothetical protein